MKREIVNQKDKSLQNLKRWGLKPLVLDFYLQRLWPTFSVERIFARIIAKKKLTETVTSLTLKPNFNFHQFQSGQHILLTTSSNGQRYSRTYSPTLIDGKYLQIAVKNIPGGKVSTQIHDTLKAGDIVEISQAFGEMIWSRLPESNHYTFCAAGVGITPLRSLISEWAQFAEAQERIDLHYWAQTEGEICFQAELLQLQQTFPLLKVFFYTTREKSAGSNRISEKLFLNHKTVFVACGPQSFVEEVKKISQLKQQKFYAEFASLVNVNEVFDPVKETFYELDYAGQKIWASSNKTILETLESQGLTPVHGCRMGICKSCTCLKETGLTLNVKNRILSTEACEEIQICVSKPRSAIVLKGE